MLSWWFGCRRGGLDAAVVVWMPPWWFGCRRGGLDAAVVVWILSYDILVIG